MPVFGTISLQLTARAELKDWFLLGVASSHTHGRGGGREGFSEGTLLAKCKTLPRTQRQGSLQILGGAHVGASGLLTQLEGSNLLFLECEEQRAH